MRVALLLLGLAACSKATHMPAIGQLVVEDATALATWRPTEFPYFAFLDADPDMLTCWRALEKKLAVAYQVYVPSGSYVILVGDLPRAKVESCVNEALLFSRMLDDDLGHDGELSVAKTPAGTVYAGWQDRRIVLGRRTDVQRALAARSSAPAWLQAEGVPTAAEVAKTGFVAVSADAVLANLLGVPTKRWKLVLESPPRDWPERHLLEDGGDALEQFGREQMRLAKRKEMGLPPDDPAPAETRAPTFHGLVEITYSTTDDAKRAAAALAKGAFAIPMEANLGAALARLPQTIDGETLVIRFDQASFPGVELEKLQAWAASLQGGA